MPLEHLVVVVPGIGGSNLASPGGRLVWGHNAGATATTAFRPEALAIDRPLVPTGLLQIFGVFPWSAVASYGRLTRQIKQRLGLRERDVTVAGPAGVVNPSASVIEFPYDFRFGMARTAERMKDAIDAVRGDRRVVVVAHSMGGLAARWWWGVLEGHRVCDGLITVGTPHRGAPKALDWLLNDIQVGPRLTHPLASTLLAKSSKVIQDWPSMYELLPRYRAIWDDTSSIYPHELAGVPHGFQQRAKDAYSTHLQLEEACGKGAQESPDSAFMAFYSSGHGTPSHAIVANGRVEVSKTDPQWLPTQGWEGGDGTVPAIAATPVDRESRPNERCWAPEHHLRLAAAPQVVRHIAQFEQASLGNVRGTAEPERPWLGLTYDEVVAAGEPGSIEFRLNAGMPSERIVASAAVKLGSGRAASLDVEATEHGWRALLPRLAPGSYEFTVAVDHVEGIDRVEASSVVGVIEV